MKTRNKPLTDAESGIEVLKVLHACQASIEQKWSTNSCMSDPSSSKIHPSAVVDDGSSIGEGTAIWHFSHICSGAVIGKNCSIGQNVLVADNAILGNGVKIQNNVAIYGGVTVEDDVFLGPSCVLTNVTNPRSQVSRKSLYEKTLICRGSTIGANATMVRGITLGRYCFIGA